MSRDEFEKEVIAFMSRIDEHMENQNKRCDSHSADIRAVRADVESLQDSRTFVKGMLEMVTKFAVIAVGISGIVYGWIECFGAHADKVVK